MIRNNALSRRLRDPRSVTSPIPVGLLSEKLDKPWPSKPHTMIIVDYDLAIFADDQEHEIC